MIYYLLSDFKTIMNNETMAHSICHDVEGKGILFIPSTPKEYFKTSKYVDELLDVFLEKGIHFESVYILDSSDTEENLDLYLQNSSLVFLMGGDTKEQNSFIKGFNLSNKLNSFAGVVIGQSAGALNMCKEVFLPDEVEFISGLGMFDDYIEVHFDIDSELQLNRIREDLDSAICIPDNGAIRVEDGTYDVIGEIYKYKNKEFIKWGSMNIEYREVKIRRATVADASLICSWWNNGEIMKDVGFPHGLGKTEEKVKMSIECNDKILLILLVDDIPIGEMNYSDLGNNVCEIGIKICEIDLQNKGYGKKFSSLLIERLFSVGYERIVLDTDFDNKRAQHVYESLGFKKLRVNENSWEDVEGNLRSSVDYELVKQDFISFIS